MTDTQTPGTSELIQRYLDSVITDAELRDLNASLAASPAARRAFIKATYHARLIAENLADALPIADRETRIAEVPDRAPASPPTLPHSAFRNPTFLAGVSAVAAVLLAACGVAIYAYFSSLPHSAIPDPTSSSPGPPVATLIENTGDLRTPHGYPAEGDDYGRGEYTLSTGKAEFMLTSAVNVKLRGQSRMVMRNNMNVALTRGSADFVVPKDATGFTVYMPNGAKVIDLGTRFRVEIDDDGQRSVRVTEGAVRIETAVATQIVHAPMFAKIYDGGAVTLSDPATIDVDFTTEEFGERKIPERWVWDSPGEATYEFVSNGGGLRMTMPAGHNAWETRGLAPIVYAPEPLPETFVLETEIHIIDGPIVLGSIALYDTHRKNFALSLGLIRDPTRGLSVGLEMPGRVVQSVPVSVAHVMLRIERTDDARFVASYRLPDQESWKHVGEIDVDTVAGNPEHLRPALLSKAWADTPGTVEYHSVQVKKNEDSKTGESESSLSTVPSP